MKRFVRLNCWVFSLVFGGLAMTWSVQVFADAVIIDHRHTDISLIPQTAIEQAKTDLHIAYGHTSHGSQLTTGMTGLVGFMNDLGYPGRLECRRREPGAHPGAYRR